MVAMDAYGTVVVEASGDRPRNDIDNGDDDDDGSGGGGGGMWH